MTYSFNYSYKKEGKRVRRTLPYNPMDMGFEFRGKKGCCLQFERGKYILRIKLDTQIVSLYQDGKPRPLLSDMNVPKTQERFEEILKPWN